MELLFVGTLVGIVSALVGIIGFMGYRAWRGLGLLPSFFSDGDPLEGFSMDDVTNELNHGRGDE